MKNKDLEICNVWDLLWYFWRQNSLFLLTLYTCVKNIMLTTSIPVICRMSDYLALHWFIFAIWFMVWTRSCCLCPCHLSDSCPQSPYFFTLMDHLHVFLGSIDFGSNQSAASIRQNEKKTSKGKWTHPIQITCMSVANMAVSAVVCLPSLLSRAWSSKHLSSPQWFKR